MIERWVDVVVMKKEWEVESLVAEDSRQPRGIPTLPRFLGGRKSQPQQVPSREFEDD